MLAFRDLWRPFVLTLVSTFPTGDLLICASSLRTLLPEHCKTVLLWWCGSRLFLNEAEKCRLPLLKPSSPPHANGILFYSARSIFPASVLVIRRLQHAAEKVHFHKSLCFCRFLDKRWFYFCLRQRGLGQGRIIRNLYLTLGRQSRNYCWLCVFLCKWRAWEVSVTCYKSIVCCGNFFVLIRFRLK